MTMPPAGEPVVSATTPQNDAAHDETLDPVDALLIDLNNLQITNLELRQRTGMWTRMVKYPTHPLGRATEGELRRLIEQEQGTLCRLEQECRRQLEVANRYQTFFVDAKNTAAQLYKTGRLTTPITKHRSTLLRQRSRPNRIDGVSLARP